MRPRDRVQCYQTAPPHKLLHCESHIGRQRGPRPLLSYRPAGPSVGQPLLPFNAVMEDDYFNCACLEDKRNTEKDGVRERGREEEDVKNDEIACVSHMYEGGARYTLLYFVCGTEC